jgi:hypothetical protein
MIIYFYFFVKALSAADFVVLAETFRSILIEDIPQIKLFTERNRARRFINLIDAFYGMYLFDYVCLHVFHSNRSLYQSILFLYCRIGSIVFQGRFGVFQRNRTGRIFCIGTNVVEIA